MPSTEIHVQADSLIYVLRSVRMLLDLELSELEKTESSSERVEGAFVLVDKMIGEIEDVSSLLRPS